MGWMFGAGLGFLFGGPLGAIVGGAMQHAVTKDERRHFEKSGPANSEAAFVSFLVAIMTKVAMADGRVSKDEVAAIHRFFAHELGYGGMELRYIDGIVGQTVQQNPDIGEIARSFRASNDHERSLLLIDLCYQVAVADGTICLQEQNALGVLADCLRLSADEHQRIRYKYSGYQSGAHRSTGEKVHPHKDDYAVLGIGPEATDGEVKKAYRQMAAQYHPDKVSHLGPELVEFANKKFAEITKANNSIRKSRNI